MIFCDMASEWPSDRLRDLPFSPSHEIREFSDLAGLQTTGNSSADKARNLLGSQAVLVGFLGGDRWISYSRRPAHYAERRRYFPTFVTNRSVIVALDHLAAQGLIENEIASPGRLGWQSRFRAKPLLVDMFEGHALSVDCLTFEPIILRDRKAGMIDYRDNDFTRSARRKLREINEMIRAADLAHPAFGSVRPGIPLRLNDRFLGLARSDLVRIFTGSFDQHGRFYRGWWQGLPKAQRSSILIGGEPCFEADFPRLHISLLYAEIGRSLDGDPYDIGGRWQRETVKRAVNILLNAPTLRSAIGAIRDGCREIRTFGEAKALIDAVSNRHEPVRTFFHSDAGLRLMNRDATIAEGVLLALCRKGIVALPVHDSFIVTERHRGLLIEAMERSLGEMLKSCASNCSKNKNRCTFPHMGSEGSVAAPAALVAAPPLVSEASVAGLLSAPPPLTFLVIPCPAAPPLAAAAAANEQATAGTPVLVHDGLIRLPSADLSRWTGGVPPPSVAAALRLFEDRWGSFDEFGALCGLSSLRLAPLVAGLPVPLEPAEVSAIASALRSLAVTVQAYCG